MSSPFPWDYDPFGDDMKLLAVVSAALLLFGLFLLFQPGPLDGLEFLSAPIDPYQGWPG